MDDKITTTKIYLNDSEYYGRLKKRLKFSSKHDLLSSIAKMIRKHKLEEEILGAKI